MGKNKVVSVTDHQNKTDVKKIRLEKPLQKLLNSIAVYKNSISFVKFCIENTTTYDTKNLKIFNKFSKQGG